MTTTHTPAAPTEQDADRIATQAAHLQAAEGNTDRVAQMYADARRTRATAVHNDPTGYEVTLPYGGYTPEIIDEAADEAEYQAALAEAQAERAAANA